MFISRNKLACMETEISCLKTGLRFERERHWELWHRVNAILEYLDVAQVNTPATTKLVKRS